MIQNLERKARTLVPPYRPNANLFQDWDRFNLDGTPVDSKDMDPAQLYKNKAFKFFSEEMLAHLEGGQSSLNKFFEKYVVTKKQILTKDLLKLSKTVQKLMIRDELNSTTSPVAEDLEFLIKRPFIASEDGDAFTVPGTGNKMGDCIVRSRATGKILLWIEVKASKDCSGFEAGSQKEIRRLVIEHGVRFLEDTVYIFVGYSQTVDEQSRLGHTLEKFVVKPMYKCLGFLPESRTIAKYGDVYSAIGINSDTNLVSRTPEDCALALTNDPAIPEDDKRIILDQLATYCQERNIPVPEYPSYGYVDDEINNLLKGEPENIGKQPKSFSLIKPVIALDSPATIGVWIESGLDTASALRSSQRNSLTKSAATAALDLPEEHSWKYYAFTEYSALYPELYAKFANRAGSPWSQKALDSFSHVPRSQNVMRAINELVLIGGIDGETQPGSKEIKKVLRSFSENKKGPSEKRKSIEQALPRFIEYFSALENKNRELEKAIISLEFTLYTLKKHRCLAEDAIDIINMLPFDSVNF